ncbi:MAG: hypothetical protein HYY43_02320, partial [Deltaproteobacteria bacterium]|nr:hypothetical protein [Deltaproteobacteria bacterium]
MPNCDRLFGLPILPVAEFNRLIKEQLGDKSLAWNDADSDGCIAPQELSAESPEILSSYVEVKKGAKKFTSEFENLYKSSVELYRNEKIKRELELTYLEEIHTDFDRWLRKNTDANEAQISAYKKGVKELLEAASVMQVIYQKQIGFNGLTGDEKLTEADSALIGRYGHPFCMGDQGAFCMALPSLSARSLNGVFPQGIKCDDMKGDLEGLENPFSTVIQNSDKTFATVPYAIAYKKDISAAVEHLRAAAVHFGEISREVPFSRHLLTLANALESEKPFPFLESDASWHVFGESDSIFMFRAGPDETGGDGVGDECQTKARFHFRLGLKVQEAKAFVDKYSPYFQKWENKVADLIGDSKNYEATAVVMNLPEFSDTIYETGDDIGGPNGTPIGQTLPNWCGADGKEEPCKRRVMIYRNKTLLSYGDKIVKKYIMPLFKSAHEEEFSSEDAGLRAVLLHEIGHNFGPQPGKPKPGADTTFDAGMGKWRGAMEEMKAEVLSLFFEGELLKEARADFKAGKISKTDLAKAETYYRKRAVYGIAWAERMILRATRGGKFEGNAYSKLSAVEVGFLLESGGLSYDESSKEFGFNFAGDKFMNGVEQLTKKMLRIYAGGSEQDASDLFLRYMEGDGFKLLHTDRLREIAGNMPSAL